MSLISEPSPPRSSLVGRSESGEVEHLHYEVLQRASEQIEISQHHTGVSTRGACPIAAPIRVGVYFLLCKDTNVRNYGVCIWMDELLESMLLLYTSTVCGINGSC
ncbi:uncharacterized protein MYCFIDRAFT_210804, partial [Pseudocercospora fijiensis CIRAD86]